MDAPTQETMEPKGAPVSPRRQLENTFAEHEALLVKQTMRGCFQECLGCDARSEYKVAPFNTGDIDGIRVSEQAMSVPDIMYADESSLCLCRVCNPAGRGFAMNISSGGQAGGSPVMYLEKPHTCPAMCIISNEGGQALDCPCCCFLPRLTPHLPGGGGMNSLSYYVCDLNLCVPKFMYHENDKPLYMVKPETCCGGCCVACNCCGKGVAYLPFYFHDPKSGEVLGKYQDPHTPQIRKVWAGLRKECCSTGDTFAVIFPPDSDPQRKAGLLGLAFLIDFVWFEGHHENR